MFQLLLMIYLLPVVIIAVLLIRFIRWLLSLALRFIRWAVPGYSVLPCGFLCLVGKGDVACGGITIAGLRRKQFLTGGKKRGRGHRLLPLARLLRSCVMEAENRRFSGVCAPPFRTPVQTHLPTLIQTHLHTPLGTVLRTPLGTLLGTPLQTPFPPLFRPMCATFFDTSPDTSGKPPIHPELPPPTECELSWSFGRFHRRSSLCSMLNIV